MPSPEPVTMVLEGVFDLPAAQWVVDVLSESDQSTEVYVDLTRIRDFDDRAVALLGRGLSEARSPVSVRGLLRHQYRLMRYLGVRSSALESEHSEHFAAGAAEA